MTLNNRILKNSADISDISLLITKLPGFVVNLYFYKLIINEAQSNNEIEGIKSTKRELSEALHEIEKSEPKKKRFLGLVNFNQEQFKLPANSS